MAVGEEQIDEAVVVVVEELEAPAAQQARRLRDAVKRRDIRERLVALVLVEREHLLIDVGDEEILLAVAVDVGGIDAHAGARPAVDAEADFGGERRSLPTCPCRDS